MSQKEQLTVNQLIFQDATTLVKAAAAPTTGTHKKGSIVLASAPAAGGSIGWVCTTAGSPGTWKTFGAIAA